MEGKKRKLRVRLGWPVTGLGLAVIALALGLLPLDGSNLNAPKWIIGMSGAVFVIGGLMMLSGEDTRFNNMMAALLLTGLGLIGGWIGIFGADEDFSGGLSFLPEAVNISLARGLFGIGALICLLLAAYAFKKQFE
ncbi:hypothetical protein G3570_03660 [Balneolaceae bacterium YR4-1]|uniref:Uncharacterized protein n=1 Tax=Halalkalibaculum roseum TaxID=2709311 RepID=A0A6M1T5Z8_9BACT|nr:hypothetical protein [Halalkalibaculum roseum]NGP75713.1 hypothetical protein [Halalkalibaculum roseum]